MNNVPQAIAQALAPFTPPEPFPRYRCAECGAGFIVNNVCVRCGAPFPVQPVKPSLIVPCPGCDGGWRDTPTGTVMCGQCRGTGRVATAGGEP